MYRIPRLAAGAVLTLFVAAGCASSDGDEGNDSGAAPAAPDDAAVLTTADSDLGEIVVDADGMTVYVFDKDTSGSGTSSCVDACLENWPAVTAETDDPQVDGVSGDVGTIERDDGTLQVTLDGLPLYTYAADSDAGDVTGQGVQGVWWVVGPDGAKLTASPSSAEAPPVPGY